LFGWQESELKGRSILQLIPALYQQDQSAASPTPLPAFTEEQKCWQAQ
jgi:transketolase N-terminal domain/subunit